MAVYIEGAKTVSKRRAFGVSKSKLGSPDNLIPSHQVRLRKISSKKFCSFSWYGIG